MSKIFINDGLTEKYISELGLLPIPAQGQVEIPIEKYEALKASDDAITLLADPDIRYNDGSKDLSPANAALHIQGNFPQTIDTTSAPAFANKVLPNGDKLFNRTKGRRFAAAAGVVTNMDFMVPFNQVKLNEIELVNGEIGDYATFEVLTAGEVYLNEFADELNVAKDFYVRKCKYDADLVIGLILRVKYFSISAKTIGINYALHEVVPA